MQSWRASSGNCYCNQRTARVRVPKPFEGMPARTHVSNYHVQSRGSVQAALSLCQSERNGEGETKRGRGRQPGDGFPVAPNVTPGTEWASSVSLSGRRRCVAPTLRAFVFFYSEDREDPTDIATGGSVLGNLAISLVLGLTIDKILGKSHRDRHWV